MRNDSDRGFTLLELLLAIVILALILATVYGAVPRAMFSKESAEERAELNSNGRQAIMRIAGDLEGAKRPLAGSRFYFRATGGGSPELQFIGVNRGGYGANRVRPGAVLIAYSLDPLPDRQGGFALRREEYLWSKLLADADGIQPPDGAAEDDTVPTAQATYLLDCPNLPSAIDLPGTCSAVTGLRLRYYDDAVRDFRDEWDSTLEQGATQDRVPAAVEIVLVVADKDGREHEFATIVDIPAARGQPTPGADLEDGNDGEPTPHG
jgi:prepilin-type N-terminal cleavage/methylation domain-containing protein